MSPCRARAAFDCAQDAGRAARPANERSVMSCTGWRGTCAGCRCRALCGFGIMLDCVGGIAQLGERLHGMQEVIGSIPFTSTNERRVRHTVPIV